MTGWNNESDGLYQGIKVYCNSGESLFAPFDCVDTDNKKIILRKNVDFDKAMEIIFEFQKAGYIGEKAGNYRYPVKVKFDNYVELLKAEREN